MSKDKAQNTKGGKGKGSAILPCGCSNTYQDARYGKGLRVANAKDGGGHTCTVCGREIK